MAKTGSSVISFISFIYVFRSLQSYVCHLRSCAHHPLPPFVPAYPPPVLPCRMLMQTRQTQSSGRGVSGQLTMWEEYAGKLEEQISHLVEHNRQLQQALASVREDLVSSSAGTPASACTSLLSPTLNTTRAPTLFENARLVASVLGCLWLGCFLFFSSLFLGGGWGGVVR